MSPVLEARAGLRAFIGLAPGTLERVRPSIVRVRGQGPAGAAGVAWGPEAVVTNHHVVAGARQALRVIGVDGRVHAARVRQASRQLDLALLDVQVDTEQHLACAVCGFDPVEFEDCAHPAGRVFRPQERAWYSPAHRRFRVSRPQANETLLLKR